MVRNLYVAYWSYIPFIKLSQVSCVYNTIIGFFACQIKIGLNVKDTPIHDSFRDRGRDWLRPSLGGISYLRVDLSLLQVPEELFQKELYGFEISQSSYCIYLSIP